MNQLNQEDKTALAARRAELAREMGLLEKSVQDLELHRQQVPEADAKKKTILEEALHKENQILKIDLLLGQEKEGAALDTAKIKALIDSKDLKAKVKNIFANQGLEFCMRPSCTTCVTGCDSECISRCTSGCSFCTSAVAGS